MPVQLLALDLDGTIFGDDLVISPRTRAAIRAAQDARVIVTIATGRMFRAARLIADDLGIDGPLICYQGALVQHSATGEILYHKTIPLPLAHEIVSATAERGLHLNVYMNDNLYVEKLTPEARFYAQINMDMAVNITGDLHTWLDAQVGDEPTKLVIVTDIEQTDATLALFTALYGDRLQVIKSHARFTEFTNKECSKGRALASLAAHYYIPQQNVMAIGDGHNDLDMIAWAGYGVAMATAPQAVLDVARIICPPLSQDGAADTIERYVLRGNAEYERKA
jgi:Cof subfamily protein (haloacid dehalogenase superfamily)